jgi:hypothetical protein
MSLSPASLMGPPFRQWHGTTSGSSSADVSIIDDAVVTVKDAVT